MCDFIWIGYILYFYFSYSACDVVVSLMIEPNCVYNFSHFKWLILIRVDIKLFHLEFFIRLFPFNFYYIKHLAKAILLTAKVFINLSIGLRISWSWLYIANVPKYLGKSTTSWCLNRNSSDSGKEKKISRWMIYNNDCLWLSTIDNLMQYNILRIYNKIFYILHKLFT